MVYGDCPPITSQDFGDSEPLKREQDAEYFMFLAAQDLQNLFSCTRDILLSSDKRNLPSSVWSSHLEVAGYSFVSSPTSEYMEMCKARASSC